MTTEEIERLIADTSINDNDVFEAVTAYAENIAAKSPIEDYCLLTDEEENDLEDVGNLLANLRPDVYARFGEPE